MSKKKGLNSQANLLRQEGVQALGTLSINDKINPIGFYSPDRERYKIIWTNYDMNQCVSRYIWKNLPNGLTSWNLERMLYFRGSVAGFKVGGKVYILPYTITGRINPYGLPTRIKPITYNGKAVAGNSDFISKSFELPVDAEGDENDEYGAVILYDSIPYSPSTKSPSRYFLNQIIINEMVDVFSRININVVVSNKKILLVIKDAKQRDVVQKELEIAFGSDSPFGIITSPLDVNTIQNTNDYNADDLFNTIKNFDCIRCFMSGIKSNNFGQEKKERLISGELQGSQEQTDLVLDMGYDLRKLFAEKCNRKFGTNIVVEKRSDTYETEVNGANRTFEEEGEE